jgi:Na+-translocating ferredoxin:NAD+ oxidoreductase RnfG subunit
MKWFPTSTAAGVLAALTGVTPIYAHTKIYVSTEQAQKLLMPQATLVQTPFIISEAVQAQMRQASSVHHPFRGDRIWRAQDNSWFIVDEVVGKHEMITYAVALSQDGTVKGIEIMEYVESYGYQVAEVAWRQQFVGKRASDPLKLGNDVKNISGATLSCKHLTDGIKRLLVLHQLLLAGHQQK